MPKMMSDEETPDWFVDESPPCEQAPTTSLSKEHLKVAPVGGSRHVRWVLMSFLAASVVTFGGLWYVMSGPQNVGHASSLVPEDKNETTEPTDAKTTPAFTTITSKGQWKELGNPVEMAAGMDFQVAKTATGQRWVTFQESCDENTLPANPRDPKLLQFVATEATWQTQSLGHPVLDESSIVLAWSSDASILVAATVDHPDRIQVWQQQEAVNNTTAKSSSPYLWAPLGQSLPYVGSPLVLSANGHTLAMATTDKEGKTNVVLYHYALQSAQWRESWLFSQQKGEDDDEENVFGTDRRTMSFGHNSNPLYLALSADGSVMAVMGYGAMQVYTASNGQPKGWPIRLDSSSCSQPHSLAVSMDTLVMGGGDVYRWVQDAWQSSEPPQTTSGECAEQPSSSVALVAGTGITEVIATVRSGQITVQSGEGVLGQPIPGQ
eukprot:scaffold37978_cov191-Amphora_coffeaeformis.AAC.1